MFQPEPRRERTEAEALPQCRVWIRSSVPLPYAPQLTGSFYSADQLERQAQLLHENTAAVAVALDLAHRMALALPGIRWQSPTFELGKDGSRRIDIAIGGYIGSDP